VLTEDEGHVKAIAGLAKLHVDAGDLEQAKAVCRWPPRPRPAGSRPRHIGGDRRDRSGRARGGAGRSCAAGKGARRQSDDNQARYDLALALSARGERDAAADRLLEIIKRNRQWNEDAARKQLVKFFEAWGLMDPAAVQARRKLSALIFF